MTRVYRKYDVSQRNIEGFILWIQDLCEQWNVPYDCLTEAGMDFQLELLKLLRRFERTMKRHPASSSSGVLNEPVYPAGSPAMLAWEQVEDCMRRERQRVQGATSGAVT